MNSLKCEYSIFSSFCPKNSWWNTVNILNTFRNFLNLFFPICLFLWLKRNCLKSVLISYRHLIHIVFIFTELVLIYIHWFQLWLSGLFFFSASWFLINILVEEVVFPFAGLFYLKSQMCTYMHIHMHTQMCACTYRSPRQVLEIICPFF